MINNIVYHSQGNESYCAPCCMSMILSSMEISISPEEIAKVVMRKNIKNGIEVAGTSDICSEISHYDVFPMAFYNMPEKNAWDFLKNCVDTGNPVIVAQIKNETNPAGHSRVVINIEKEKSTFMIDCLDPDEGDPITQMSKERFIELWKAHLDFSQNTNFAMTVIRKNRSKLQKKKCFVCDSVNIVTVVRRFDIPDLQFINPDAISRMNGTIFKCNDCSTQVHHFP